jgi:Flp pilus assembly protein TadG
MKKIKRIRCRRRGTIAVLAAVFLVVIVALAAYSIDTGRITVAHAELQDAADAAAMAGARGLSTSPTVARTRASYVAGLNHAAGDSVSLIAQDIEIGTWNKETATFTVLPAEDESQGDAVRVTCRRSANQGNPLTLFFGSMFGASSTDVSASAVTTVEPSRCGLIIGLNKFSMSGSSHTDSYNAENGPYSAASAGMEGHACSNTTIKMSGSTAIGGDAHPGPGETVDSSSSVGVLGEIEPLQKPLVLAPINPGDAPTNNNNDDIPLSDDNKDPLNDKGEFTLSGGDHVALPPGTYYFSKLTLSGGSSISISGKTIVYVTGTTAISGGSVTNTTFLPKNFQLYGMGDVKISGDSEFYGAVYAPSSKVERSGGSGYFGMIAGVELVLSGDGGIHADLSLDILDGSDGKVSLVQ